MVRLLGSWAAQAACAEPNAPAPNEFFPEDVLGTIQPEHWPVEALATCRGCPVREKCLAYAMQNKVEGVWGGTTDADRKILAAAARRAAA